MKRDEETNQSFKTRSSVPVSEIFSAKLQKIGYANMDQCPEINVVTQ